MTIVTAEASMNLPTLLTLFRIVMGPAIAGLVLWAASVVYEDRLLAGYIYALCFILFALAAATDWLDGWLARRMSAVTPLGAALDHTADKVLITCVLVALAYASLPLTLVAAAVVILGRDVALSGLREGYAGAGISIPVGELGKWKTTTLLMGVGAFLAFQAAALLGGPETLIQGLTWAAQILIWAAAALALVSGWMYLAALRRN
jgi:CDP-diacylglycerol--glycerol-3-phosphate 3-phosphatidyltransferase